MTLYLVSELERDEEIFQVYGISDYTVRRKVYSSGWESISISSPRGDKYRFLPNIYFEEDIITEEKKFTIQTTSYGALNAEEITEVINGYNKALEVVEILTKEFIK